MQEQEHNGRLVNECVNDKREKEREQEKLSEIHT